MQELEAIKVRVNAVNTGGAVTCVQGVSGFIPFGRLANKMSYIPMEVPAPSHVSLYISTPSHLKPVCFNTAFERGNVFKSGNALAEWGPRLWPFPVSSSPLSRFPFSLCLLPSQLHTSLLGILLNRRPNSS